MMKYEGGKREKGRGNREKGDREEGDRIVGKRNGQTNPPRSKSKATIETGRAVPHAADGAARTRHRGGEVKSGS